MKKYWKIILTLFGISAVVNLLAFIRPLCDLYSDTVYGVISDSLGFLLDKLPFALGEILILGAIVVVSVFLIMSILCIFLKKKKKYVKVYQIYAKSILMVLAVFVLVMTFNWSLPLRSSVLGQKETRKEITKYTLEELITARSEIVYGLNQAVYSVERDSEGHLVIPENYRDIVREEMRSHSDEYPRLSGYYPEIKNSMYSDFLDWMNIGGFTNPFTMEILQNKYSNSLYFINLFAHESAHHQGYYRESEATYFECICLMESEDPILRYAGYDTAYYYVNSDFDEAMAQMTSDEYSAIWAGINQNDSDRIFPCGQYYVDSGVLLQEYLDAYEEDDHPAEAASDVISDMGDIGWDVQEKVLQEDNYDGVTQLLLEYYDKNGLWE